MYKLFYIYYQDLYGFVFFLIDVLYELICNRDYLDDCIFKFVIRVMRIRMVRIYSEMVFFFMIMYDFDYIEKIYYQISKCIENLLII